MKAKVIKRYNDKDTNLLQEIGTEVEVTQKRFDEINSTVFGVFLEVVKEVKKKETKKETTKK